MLSAVCAGVRPNKKNTLVFFLLFVICGILQLFFFFTLEEDFVWKIYPCITHIPIVLLLCLYYHKRLITAIAAVTTAYLFCQPAKWISMLTTALGGGEIASHISYIVVLLILGAVMFRFLGSYLADIYNKESRSVVIFGIVPVIYYGFDYVISIYTEIWTKNNRIAIEFLPFFLCIVYMIFCVVYYKEEELKADAERKEQMIRLAAEQQSREIQAIKRSEQEIRLLRHDMRLLLNNLAVSIENNDSEHALKMISGYVSQIDKTMIHRYCENDTINYILSGYATKCQEQKIAFHTKVAIEAFTIDEVIFASILSNALDNAVNAQATLPESERSISVMLKTSNEKLLLSVQNRYDETPVFVDGMPVSNRKGHGYGTQSIVYLTERLGGNCHFSLQDERFLLRVII